MPAWPPMAGSTTTPRPCASSRVWNALCGFDGLNLTWETLEGLVKHNGPLLTAQGAPTPRYAERGIPAAILEYDAVYPLDLALHAGPEAQAAALADDNRLCRARSR